MGGDLAKRILIFVLTAAMVLLPTTASGDPATATKVCTWGGSPTATLGVLTIKPGLSSTPASDDLKFEATGSLGGAEGCDGVVTFTGVIEAGSTCAHQLMFDGKVKGLPGVDRFRGPGVVPLVFEFLYDKDGNIVGSDQPQVLTGAGQGSEISDCNTPEGFTKGMFSSVIEVWGS
jgi:hypothetical protein